MDSNLLHQELESGNYRLPLKPSHREAMLDLVLAWGTLDGALAMLLAAVMGVPDHEAADIIGKQSGSGKLAETIRLMKSGSADEKAVKFLKKNKTAYERHSKPRNRISHGHCAGYLSADENYVVFAIFERVGSDNLAVEAIPTDEMERATQWGKAFTSFIFTLLANLEKQHA